MPPSMLSLLLCALAAVAGLRSRDVDAAAAAAPTSSTTPPAPEATEPAAQRQTANATASSASPSNKASVKVEGKSRVGAAFTGRSNGAAAKPKLMVVYASGAAAGNETTPRTMLLWEDDEAGVLDRADTDVAEEPSAELRPPHQDASPGRVYDYRKPQQDAAQPSAGYDYQKPQQDVAKPSPGYDYQKPQQDELKPSGLYTHHELGQSYAQPSQGYDYPRPQEDEASAGYRYPKPGEGKGYAYPRPQQDDPQAGYGYSYPRPIPADPVAGSWTPVDSDYLPPKEQLPLEEATRPAWLYGRPSRPDQEQAKVPAMQDELPFSYNPPSGAPVDGKQPLRDDVADSYLPPKQPLRDEVPSNSYGPPKQPLRDEVPSNSYGPPKQTLRDEVPSNSYGPPKQPLRDEVPSNSYGPPKQPLRDEVPSNSYGPPKQPLRDELPSNSYGPPKQPLRDELPSNSYGPPKQPLRDELPSNSYGPPKQPLRDELPSNSYGPPKQPLRDELPSNSYGPPKQLLPEAQPRHLGDALHVGAADERGIRVTDMSCFRTATRARFTATVTSSSFVAWPPVLEAVVGGGATATGCRIIADPADPHHRFLVDLSNPDLKRCGVKGCSADGEARLCARLLLPAVPGLRTAADPVLLLQCSLQPATASLLQQARIAAVQPASGRSAGVVHVGGERAPLHAHLQLLRRGEAGDFSRAMQPGAAVHLGDDVQLRAVVRRGDGWQSSRLADVVVRRGSDAVHLVSSDGCGNADMRAVCPRPQAWLAGDPLVSLLNMRVFMFRGMQDGDQLVLSARVVACLDRGDCKTSPESCDSVGRGSRARRSSQREVLNQTTTTFTTTTTSYEGSFAFSVRLAPAHPLKVGLHRMPIIFIIGVFLLALTISTLILFSCWKQRQKLHRDKAMTMHDQSTRRVS